MVKIKALKRLCAVSTIPCSEYKKVYIVMASYPFSEVENDGHDKGLSEVRRQLGKSRCLGQCPSTGVRLLKHRRDQEDPEVPFDVRMNHESGNSVNLLIFYLL